MIPQYCVHTAKKSNLIQKNRKRCIIPPAIIIIFIKSFILIKLPSIGRQSHILEVSDYCNHRAVLRVNNLLVYLSEHRLQILACNIRSVHLPCYPGKLYRCHLAKSHFSQIITLNGTINNLKQKNKAKKFTCLTLLHWEEWPLHSQRLQIPR